eukprot:TRINITY_DN2590_c0_g2_i1.p2 TRINITY_DN2590_c0_g2~~TRINITY_DN2590_c0_g2_i1.p2  ORF type:complete len:134 (-),score=27.35 TRINITY_DN2590_c0_g2_i1:67-426(-)
MASGFQAFLNHPAGPKTIHFWAPAMKWGLVIAGLADINRPPERISGPQATALSATGLIWARYSTQITPVNYNLLSVNVFVAITGIYQLARKYYGVGPPPPEKYNVKPRQPAPAAPAAQQ